MSSNFTLALGNKIVRWLGGVAMPTAPSFIECALYDGNPKTSGTDITDDVRPYGGREIVTFTVPSSGSGNELSNSVAVDFGLSEADVSLSHIALFNGDNGDLLGSIAVPSGPLAVTVGSSVKFNIGGLKIQVGSGT